MGTSACIKKRAERDAKGRYNSIEIDQQFSSFLCHCTPYRNNDTTTNRHHLHTSDTSTTRHLHHWTPPPPLDTRHHHQTSPHIGHEDRWTTPATFKLETKSRKQGKSFPRRRFARVTSVHKQICNVSSVKQTNSGNNMLTASSTVIEHCVFSDALFYLNCTLMVNMPLLLTLVFRCFLSRQLAVVPRRLHKTALNSG